MAVRSTTSGNALGTGLSANAGCWANLPTGDWVIGLWIQRDVLHPTGVVFSVAGGTPATFAASMTAVENLLLWDGGATSATDPYRMYLSGKDSAGTAISTIRNITTNGSTFATMPLEGYERQGNTRETLFVQHRAGVIEVWRCRVGQRAQLIAANMTAWAGFTDNRPISFLRARFGSAQPFMSMIDRPFHISGRSLTQVQMEQFTNGARANDLDKSGYASGVIQFATVTTAGTNPSDTYVRANPTAGTTLTLNGTVVTFVASGATGNQVNIGTALSDTVTNLLTFLNASTDTNLATATYASFQIDGVIAGIRITAKTAGATGENYTIASSSTNCRFGSAGKLSYCEWEFGALSAASTVASVSNGAYLPRASNLAWLAATADLGEPLNANYVTTDYYSPGTVFQIDEKLGTATFTVTGSYGGADPSAIQYTAMDLSNSTNIASAVNVVNLVASGGTWSGTVTLAKGLRWLAWRLNKLGFAAVNAECPFGIGLVIALSGQSLMAILTKFPAFATPDSIITQGSTVSNGYASRFLPLSAVVNGNHIDFTSGLTGWYQDDNWHRMTATDCGGSGEAALCNTLSTAAGCVVGMFNRSVGGTTIQLFITDAPYWATDLAKSKTNRISRFIWSHGTADAGNTNYPGWLDQLDAGMRSAINADFDFCMAVQDNNTISNDGTDGINYIRFVHQKWIRDRAAAAPTLYYELMDMTDLGVQFTFDIGDGVNATPSTAPTNTPYDGVHPKRGIQASKKGERMGAALAWRAGFRSTTMVGPTIVRAIRTGAQIDIKIAGTAGANLVTGSTSTVSTTTGGAPSGFDVSADGFATLLTISSTAIIDANTVRIILAADPGAEVDVMYLYGRPGNSTFNHYSYSGTDPGTLKVIDTTGRAAVTKDYTLVQDNMLYDGQTGFTYCSTGILVKPLLTAMRTIPTGHVAKVAQMDQTVLQRIGNAGISSDGRLQIVW